MPCVAWSRLREAGLELGEPRLLYWSGNATAAGHASTGLLHCSYTIVKGFQTGLDRRESGSDADYDRSGRHLGKLLTIRRRVGRRVSGVLDLACELQRGGNCRDSD